MIVLWRWLACECVVLGAGHDYPGCPKSLPCANDEGDHGSAVAEHQSDDAQRPGVMVRVCEGCRGILQERPDIEVAPFGVLDPYDPEVEASSERIQWVRGLLADDLVVDAWIRAASMEEPPWATLRG